MTIPLDPGVGELSGLGSVTRTRGQVVVSEISLRTDQAFFEPFDEADHSLPVRVAVVMLEDEWSFAVHGADFESVGGEELVAVGERVDDTFAALAQLFSELCFQHGNVPVSMNERGCDLIVTT